MIQLDLSPKGSSDGIRSSCSVPLRPPPFCLFIAMLQEVTRHNTTSVSNSFDGLGVWLDVVLDHRQTVTRRTSDGRNVLLRPDVSQRGRRKGQ